jgi:hypothetical protein
MGKAKKCPGCGQHNVNNHPEDGCVVASLIRVIRDRGDLNDSVVNRIHAALDVDAVWDVIGELIDDIQAGRYLDDAADPGLATILSGE